MEFLENPKFIRIFDISSTILILILTIVIAYLVITKEIINPVCEETTKETITERKEEEKGQSKETTSSQEIFVDIKGAVKTPGVYKVKEDAIINDVIRLAGGLKSNASTKYINLSKKVSNEMVITIFTSSQINQLAKQEALSMESCICSKEDISECKNSSVIETAKEESKSQINGSNKETNEEDSKKNSTSDKVSLNSGTKEELMSLSGIGEAKALAIIEYRTKNNGFKSLDELMNISGIGASAYAKIKDNIKL